MNDVDINSNPRLLYDVEYAERMERAGLVGASRDPRFPPPAHLMVSAREAIDELSVAASAMEIARREDELFLQHLRATLPAQNAQFIDRVTTQQVLEQVNITLPVITREVPVNFGGARDGMGQREP